MSFELFFRQRARSEFLPHVTLTNLTAGLFVPSLPRKASVPTVRTLAVSPLVMEAAAVSMAACVCACLCDGSAALELRTTRETQVLYSLLYPFPLMSLHQFHAPHGQIRSKSFH